MASQLGPNAQRRYYNTPSNANSATSLLPNQSAPAPGQQGLSPQAQVRAALATGPALRNQASNASLNTSPYTSASAGKAPSIAPSISDKFSMAADPTAWGADLASQQSEPDDYLHNPDPKRDRKNDAGGSIFTARGMMNLGCLMILALGILTLFAGYPLISHFTKTKLTTNGGFNIGGVNASGIVPSMGNWAVIDPTTPKEALTKKPYTATGDDWILVFSDEFNVEGRSFYPGDDPYWEAVDLHYWQTNNMEWYDPEAVTTKDGALKITLSKKKTHGLDYQGGLISTWNKFCFTGGLVETAVTLPGINNVVGLWPAVWAMGNLGRAGYGASLEGMWPYTYDSCDIGTVANQSIDGRPLAATINGDNGQNGILSFLPGQRLSRCSCPGSSHPGPMHADGTFVGRSAPEIDIFEAQITGDPLTGQVSQSGQWAPFNAAYTWFNDSESLFIANESITELNSYKGGVFQQATSGVTETNPDCYELGTGCTSVYGFEYKPGFDGAYITWISSGVVAWTVHQSGLRADTAVEIDQRPVPQEPMYLIANLGMSTNFGTVDLDHLQFPTTLSVDWIRVYQPKDQLNVGCDPPNFPTAQYIETYKEAYTNPNLMLWRGTPEQAAYGQPFPKNKFLGEC